MSSVKDIKQLVKLIVILALGFTLSYRTYQYRFSTFIFDETLFGGLTFVALILWIWFTIRDLNRYRQSKNNRFLVIPILGLFFAGLSYGIHWKTQERFDKPTLMFVYYDGDFNGTSIDLKTDGTYILDNHAIGMSNYFYGTYTMDGALIYLDKKEIENVIKSDILSIKPLSETNDELYVFQVDSEGTKIDNATQFRVVKDHRK